MKPFRSLPLVLAGVVLATTVAGVAVLANSRPAGPAPSSPPPPSSPIVTPSPAPSDDPGDAIPIKVDLANVEGRNVYVDIVDRSGRLGGARSGQPGSGPSVGGPMVTNVDERTLKVEWADFAIDNALALYVDATASGIRLVLVQPAPTGDVDAMASGRALILEFEDEISAADVEASLVKALES